MRYYSRYYNSVIICVITRVVKSAIIFLLINNVLIWYMYTDPANANINTHFVTTFEILF